MTFETFADFFKKATGGNTPYNYQSRLAEADSIPQVLNIPTGAGKTEAAVLALYMWRRVNDRHPMHDDAPRRLVYCLPMRVLVEQTVDRIRGWIQELGLEKQFKVVTLMGGDVGTAYRKCPEKDMIIVGTQDMLLSRALNRGYSMNIFQWPVEFGLLNNDCMWIVDEIQLMQNGLATTAQLEAFRTNLDTFGPHRTVWMSATISNEGLKTPDFKEECDEVKLGDDDLSQGGPLHKRCTAVKKLEWLSLPNHKDEYGKKDADVIVSKHIKGSNTLVIVNTVKRAQTLFKEIQKTGHNSMLVHSRFRKGERNTINKKLMALNIEDDLIIVSTQVVEAGVDLSARTMITEMAPWPSMIQRFGRCNRKGLDRDSTIYVVDVDDKHYQPYDAKDMECSRQRINDRIGRSVSPKDLGDADHRPRYDAVIRKADIIDLFDTSPDLFGNYTDVSRFVRSLEEPSDVDVLWRTWDGLKPVGKVEAHEVCSVPIGDAKRMKSNAWVYSYLSGEWEKMDRDPYPGQTILVDAKSGGYDHIIGFDPSIKNHVPDATAQDEPPSNIDNTVQDSHDGDVQSENSGWITLNDHTVHVINEARKITDDVRYIDAMKENIMIAAKYHDIGKAHHVFQETMLRKADGEVSKDELWAKCPFKGLRHQRENFRHEAVSAAAFQKLELGLEQDDVDLISYLIASHHGKMRLAMRPAPKKRANTYANPDENTILGLYTDKAEAVKIFTHPSTKTKHSKERSISDSDVEAEVRVDASMAQMGMQGSNRSWTHIALKRLESLGPFRLAYLESIVRAADSRASEMERT